MQTLYRLSAQLMGRRFIGHRRPDLYAQQGAQRLGGVTQSRVELQRVADPDRMRSQGHAAAAAQAA